MLQMGLIEVIQSERERQIEEAIRRRQLLRPQDENEQATVSPRPEARTMAVRTPATDR